MGLGVRRGGQRPRTRALNGVPPAHKVVEAPGLSRPGWVFLLPCPQLFLHPRTSPVRAAAASPGVTTDGSILRVSVSVSGKEQDTGCNEKMLNKSASGRQ